MTDFQREVLAWYARGNVGTRVQCSLALGRTRASKNLMPVFRELCEMGEIEHFEDQIGVNLAPIAVYRKAIKPPVWDVPLVTEALPIVEHALAARSDLERVWR